MSTKKEKKTGTTSFIIGAIVVGILGLALLASWALMLIGIFIQHMDYIYVGAVGMNIAIGLGLVFAAGHFSARGVVPTIPSFKDSLAYQEPTTV